MTDTLLSIVIANYNYGRFLQDALKSIFKQCGSPVLQNGRSVLPIRGCESAVEVIICDAASSDNSVEIIKANSDKIAWWCSEKDGGQSAAFNKGFSHARGEWLTWLNSDDLYLPGTLRAFTDCVKRNRNAEWITGNMLSFDTDTGRILNVNWGPHFLPNFLQRKKWFCAVFGPTTFFKKSLYTRMGAIDEKLHYAMDTEYWIRLSVSGVKQTRLKHICWAFRHHIDSKTVGIQSNTVLLRMENETRYWHEKYKWNNEHSILNAEYLLWVLWRFIDGSWCKRWILKHTLEGSNGYSVLDDVR